MALHADRSLFWEDAVIGLGRERVEARLVFLDTRELRVATGDFRRQYSVADPEPKTMSAAMRLSLCSRSVGSSLKSRLNSRSASVYASVELKRHDVATRSDGPTNCVDLRIVHVHSLMKISTSSSMGLPLGRSNAFTLALLDPTATASCCSLSTTERSSSTPITTEVPGRLAENQEVRPFCAGPVCVVAHDAGGVECRHYPRDVCVARLGR